MTLFNRGKQAGDTIVEVLISVSILSVVLVGCYTVVNHSLQTGTESAQRSEALALAQEQIEYIKNASINNTNQLSAYQQGLTGSTNCIVNGVVSSNSSCQTGQYTISTSYSTPVFTTVASWPA